MPQQFPGQRRHAGEAGDPLPLDEAQRLGGIPVVHEDQRAARGRDRVQDAGTTGHVEQRHRQQRHRRAGILGGGRQTLLGQPPGAGGIAAVLDECEVQQVVGRSPVRGLRALGETRGARGVEDADVVVGFDLGGRQFRRGAGGVEGVVPPVGACRQVAVVAGHDERCRAGTSRQALQAFPVEDGQRRRGVTERELQLGAGPPGVHGHRGGAGRRDRPVRQHPLGVVAHGDRHPVAAADAVLVAQVVGQRPHPGGGTGVAVALVAVDEVLGVAAGSGLLPDDPHVGRGAVECSHRHIPHVPHRAGERAARGRQLGIGAGESGNHPATGGISRAVCIRAPAGGHRWLTLEHR